VSEAWMRPAAKTLYLFAAHSEQVTKLPKGARILGGDEFCPAGSLAVGQHFFTTEYHPEMTEDFFVALTHAFESYIGSDVARRARLQVIAQQHDGLTFAEWMARFFEMPRLKA
jgi:GMP synthase-like glutamine amidotransferase